MRFSKDLWKTILDFVGPSAVICLGDVSARQLGATLASMGWLLKSRETGPVGWGSVSYELARYESSGRRCCWRGYRISRASGYSVGRRRSRRSTG